eukprot:15453493-Alexandrium_andersonii.AAC.1
MECSGIPPPQLFAFLVPKLEKPTGGYRPIGLGSSFYRLWGRLRRPLCDKWESENDRPYFASGAA